MGNLEPRPSSAPSPELTALINKSPVYGEQGELNAGLLNADHHYIVDWYEKNYPAAPEVPIKTELPAQIHKTKTCEGAIANGAGAEQPGASSEVPGLAKAQKLAGIDGKVIKKTVGFGWNTGYDVIEHLASKVGL
jgi:hypothetical protein